MIITISKDQRVYLHMCSFQPALNGSFFGAGDLLLNGEDAYSRTGGIFIRDTAYSL